MRLNAYLARAGVASRRKADTQIKAGRVTVNGEPGQLNTFVAKRDRVELDGRPLERQGAAALLVYKTPARPSPTPCSTSRQASSRPRAIRRDGRPSSGSSRTTRPGLSRSGGSTPTR